MKQEKNDKVSLNISQTAIVLIIAMVFTGLSIQIARFHSHSRRGGGLSRVKNTCAGTLAENGRGGVFARGGVIAGFYGNTTAGEVIPWEGTRCCVHSTSHLYYNL